MTPQANLARLLEVDGFSVKSSVIENRTLWIDLRRHRRRLAECGRCGQKTSRVHDRDVRSCRDLAVCGLRTHLRFETVRVACPTCEKPRQERIAWLSPNPRYTRRFAYQVARLTLAMPIVSAAQIAEIAWGTTKNLMAQVAKLELSIDKPPDDLRWIGVDEKSWRKGRRFATVVSDLKTGRVIWIGKGRSKGALGAFFVWLGKPGCKRIEAAAIDLSGPYEAAVREHCPWAKVVFDRYHVVKLLLDALNDVRKRVVIDADREDRDLVTNKKWILLSHRERLDQDGKAELNELFQANRELAVGYILKEDFLRIYDYRHELKAGEFPAGWVRRAMASELEPFKRFATLVANRLDGFLNHVRHPVPMGVVEALNSRLEGLIRRARGFRSVEGFIAVALFVCGRPASLIGDTEVFRWSL